MEIKWFNGDICLMDTRAGKGIEVQVMTSIWLEDVGEVYIVEETLAPFEKHICFDNDLYDRGWG